MTDNKLATDKAVSMNDQLVDSNPSLKKVLIVVGVVIVGLILISYRSSFGF